MADLKTVEGNMGILDPIYQKQKEGVAKMRTSLLACSDDLRASRQALQNITTMRIYHQIARIIKYLELMDKLEAKLYESIDATIDSANVSSPSTWITLLSIQERLQKSMIESQKLLQQLDIQALDVIDLSSDAVEDFNAASQILDSDVREKIRNNAQAVLLELKEGEDS